MALPVAGEEPTSLSSLGVRREVGAPWDGLTPGAVGKVFLWEVCVLPAPSPPPLSPPSAPGYSTFVFSIEPDSIYDPVAEVSGETPKIDLHNVDAAYSGSFGVRVEVPGDGWPAAAVIRARGPCGYFKDPALGAGVEDAEHQLAGVHDDIRLSTQRSNLAHALLRQYRCRYPPSAAIDAAVCVWTPTCRYPFLAHEVVNF